MTLLIITLFNDVSDKIHAQGCDLRAFVWCMYTLYMWNAWFHMFNNGYIHPRHHWHCRHRRLFFHRRPPFLTPIKTQLHTYILHINSFGGLIFRQLGLYWWSSFLMPAHSSTPHSLIRSLPQVFRSKFVSFCKRTHLYLAHVHSVLPWLHSTVFFQFLFCCCWCWTLLYFYLFIHSYYIVVLLL